MDRFTSPSWNRRNAAKMVKYIVSFSVAVMGALAGRVAGAGVDWPEFRGPWGDGHVSAPGETKLAGFPIHWSETENVKWKTEIPYRGWSTPVVMDSQVWVTTATEDGHDFFALCLDADTGKIQFNEKLFHCDTPEPLGNNVNSYATPSPVIEPGRVYVHFGSYGTACLNTAAAKVVWKRDDLPCRHYRGPSSSPILFENLLILTMDGVNLEYTVALDKNSGRTVWKTDRAVVWNDENDPGQMAKDGDRRKAHSTPLIVKVADKVQMLSAGAKAAYAYDPRIWSVSNAGTHNLVRGGAQQFDFPFRPGVRRDKNRGAFLLLSNLSVAQPPLDLPGRLGSHELFWPPSRAIFGKWWFFWTMCLETGRSPPFAPAKPEHLLQNWQKARKRRQPARKSGDRMLNGC